MLTPIRKPTLTRGRYAYHNMDGHDLMYRHKFIYSITLGLDSLIEVGRASEVKVCVKLPS